MTGSATTQSALTFPVSSTLNVPAPFVDNVTVTQGGNSITFAFTQEFTHTLTATTSTAGGSVELDFLGTVGANTVGYDLGTSASMSLVCTQTGLGAAIGCVKTLASPSVIPPPVVPEPASLALLGSALAGLGLFRRRRQAA